MNGNVRCIVLMAIVVFVVLRVLKRDFSTGLALVVGLLVSLPDYLRVNVGGGVPALTIHRVLLVILLIKWWPTYRLTVPRPKAPLLGGLLAFGAAQFLSLLFSVSKIASVNSFFVFSLEVVVFYVIISTSLRKKEDVIRVLFGLAFGLGVVAVIEGIERRYDWNLSHQIVLGYDWEDVDITATYPHRILLGYAMAMAVPILLATIEQEQRKKFRRLLWLMLMLAAAGCYFANSRGPWVGLALGTAPMILLGSAETKKGLRILGAVGVVVLIVRPGVLDSLRQKYYETFVDKDSVKAESYEYRKTLWHIAFAETAKSPERTLFGYGGLSTESMDLSRYFESEHGGTATQLGYTSWDNQMACDLMEFGYAGFLSEMALLMGMIWTYIALWRRLPSFDRNFMVAFIAASLIYVYALTNVYIFSPQLKCLFWSLVACGIRYGQLALQNANAEQATQPLEDPLRRMAGARAMPAS